MPQGIVLVLKLSIIINMSCIRYSLSLLFKNNWRRDTTSVHRRHRKHDTLRKMKRIAHIHELIGMMSRCGLIYKKNPEMTGVKHYGHQNNPLKM